jgi:hypothetical protein
MTIELYEYNHFPKNPKIKPNFFKKKYFRQKYEICESDDLKSGINSFILQMNLIFGNECHFDYNDARFDINRKNTDKIVKEYCDQNIINPHLDILHDILHQPTAIKILKNNKGDFSNLFAILSLGYKGLLFESKWQIIHRNVDIFTDPMFMMLNFKFDLLN